jgi:thiamine pyrophosphate-dependent acetolactate synthase large subunit-like protein
MTTVADAVGAALAQAGVRTVFGVVGSGNFHVTNALTAGGARFVAARHEGGAAVMADAYARLSGELGVLSVHQGPGLTNALTGITEAAKSRTPLLILAPAATNPRSNFYLDDAALATAVGAVPVRLGAAATAAADLARACRIAVAERRTVLLSMPLDVQTAAASPFTLPAVPPATLPAPASEAVAALADALTAARRPVFLAGRGARNAGKEIKHLSERTGALLATSAVSRGLFRDAPFSLDVSGGFATPVAADLIKDADLLVGWGCALNMWTLRHGTLVGDNTTVVQVDLDPDALGAHQRIDLDVPGADGFVFTQAFQSIGLGLATAIGAAVARPDRLTVAALGDGGLLMSVADLETAVRLGLDLLVVVYDDEAYGAEVHHFGPDGYPLDHVTFPPADIAGIGRGFGCAAVTVRALGDLDAVAAWLAGPRDRPMVVDAKVTRGEPSWWLAEAFRGH